jgi:K+ transporter
MIVLRVLAWVFALVAVCAGGWLGRNVPFAEQWPMFEGLRTTAAIIFGVIGAWLAIIYPERLKLSFKPRKDGAPSETGIGQLFSPVVNSTLILGAILLSVEWCRGISYGVLVALTLFQLWTVLLTLVPANTIKTFVDQEDEGKRALEGLFSLSQNSKQ